MLKKDLIHKRNISMETYEIGDDLLLIEGVLTDDRYHPSYFYSAEEFIGPRIIHHILVRLHISLPELLITSAEAEMRAVPSKICHEIKDCVKKLEGIKIKRGFTRNVKNIIGGATGCLHILNLILSMGSAAAQGQWAYYSRQRKDTKLARVPEIDLSILRNSCWMWRDDGPYVEKIRKMEKEQKKIKKESVS